MNYHDLRVLMGTRAYNLARLPGETRSSRNIFKALMFSASYGASYEDILKNLDIT
jgi:hypothetical protein